MPHEVFISYARNASAAEAQALAAKLGELAFLDTDAIDYGDRFPLLCLAKIETEVYRRIKWLRHRCLPG